MGLMLMGVGGLGGMMRSDRRKPRGAILSPTCR